MNVTQQPFKITSIALRLFFWIGALLLALAALQVLGAFAPSIPILGFLGSVLLPKHTPWFVIGAAGAGLVGVWRWSNSRSRTAMAALVVSALTCVGAGIIYVVLIHTAEANGVHVNIAQTFNNTSVMQDTMHEEVETYATFETKPLEVLIYRPVGNSPHPVLLYVHGGGWVSGTKEDRVRDMRWFADQGWLVFSISYGLTREDRPMWGTITPQIGCAMAWLGLHTSMYGGDISTLSLIGESAGGNLVLNSAYMANSGKLASSCGGTVPKVKAVIAAYPVVSADAEYNHHDLLLGSFARRMAIYYTGGTPQQYPDRYQAVRSTTYITALAPATLVIEGTRDHLVPPSATYDFVNQARAGGVSVSLIKVPFGEHSFDLTEGSVGNQIFRQASLHFLNDHQNVLSK